MTKMTPFEFAPGVRIGDNAELVVIAGPCVIESRKICLEIAETMRETCRRLGVQYVFKASYDKANRTSLSSPRGPGLEKGLEILATVKREIGVPILTDIHEAGQVELAAETVDVLQVPAFLSRQTDLLLAAAESGKTVNIKKGQFLAPEDMKPVLEKVYSTGNRKVALTERGSSFGYHNLVVDMRGLMIMRELGAPVIFDCTHAVQLPGGQGGASGGQREFVAPLARAAAATGINGLFMEVHPNPAEALSDGPNSLPLNEIEEILRKVVEIHDVTRKG
ncbi:MAG: 3-deoxy-8-phosphooctulonate synthase [Lentisphaeria bacterium]